jgi:hypothetical protein
LDKPNLEEIRFVARTGASEFIAPSIPRRKHLVGGPARYVNLDDDMCVGIDFRVLFQPERDQAAWEALTRGGKNRANAGRHAIVASEVRDFRGRDGDFSRCWRDHAEAPCPKG